MPLNSSLTQNTHSFHSFVRYNNEITLARAKSRYAEAKDAREEKGKKRKVTKATKKKVRQTNEESDPSVGAWRGRDFLTPSIVRG